MKLKSVVESLQEIAPLHHAGSWDNVGLLINPLTPRPIRTILLTIDLTEAVADEAIAKNADLIVSYHPILFQPLQRLNADDGYDRTVMKLIKSETAVYSPHTALDVVVGGVNDWLAHGVGQGTVSPLQPFDDSDAGQGRLVQLDEAISLADLTERLKQFLGLETVRTASSVEQPMIKSVALCAGAGSDVFQGVKADCFLTGEMSHHHILATIQNEASVILCEHTNTERGYLPLFKKILTKGLGKEIDILISEIDSDPIKFN